MYFLEKIKRMELNIMNKKLMAAAVMCSLMSATALAANPIPTFDKEAVTTHPYNRTGQQEQQVEGMQGASFISLAIQARRLIRRFSFPRLS